MFYYNSNFLLVGEHTYSRRVATRDVTMS